VIMLPRTTAFGYFAQNFVGLAERLTDHLAHPAPGRARERLWKFRAKQVVLATGAIERPLVFGGNDRPGVMLAGAARSFVNRWAVKPGTRAVLFTADDAGYGAAHDLARAGIEIAAVAELRDAPGCDIAGLPVRPRSVVVGTSGRLHVRAAELRSLEGGATERVACDLLLMAGGWTPSLHLFSQSRGKLEFDGERQVFLPGAPAQDQICAGACRGLAGLAACLADGYAAGARAAGLSGVQPSPRVEGEVIPRGGFHGAVPGTPRGKAFVDFQNDVTASDIALAVREGFRSIEHVKRYTTAGMATDQGKTSNMNALALAADALGQPMPVVGLTTFRMPYTPVTFGTFAGHARGALLDPVRRTPMHPWAAANGAVFEDVGQWKRAHHFAGPGETGADAVARECRAARGAVGLFDASTLGKIEVVGPDAAAFLDRIYINALGGLAPGRCRYGLMLNEAGFVMDDGIVARLSADRFQLTTTTTGVGHVLAHMEDFLQTEFTDLCCWLTQVTDQWAVIAIQGPRSRSVLAPLVDGIDLSPEALPHMSVREGRIRGIPARLFRVSFTGELGFEINVPAGHGPDVWDALRESGEGHGMMPYGTEAMHVMRAEKGYIIVGRETDGTVTPDDLGLGWMIGRGKRDFIGKRSLARPDLVATGRMQLVGLLTEEPSIVLEEGAQLVAERASAPGTPSIGHVTSSYWSPVLGRSIALALVADGRARMHELLFVPTPRGLVSALVSSPVFYDPEGIRLRA
jgi:sarcosine oxidase subunit alpha